MTLDDEQLTVLQHLERKKKPDDYELGMLDAWLRAVTDKEQKRRIEKLVGREP
jgi:hypothetical protein